MARMGKVDFSKLAEFTNKVEQSLSKEEIKEIGNVINTKFGSNNELSKYHKQLDDLRNDFAHGNISEEEFSHIKQEIKKLFDKYHNFIKIEESL